MARDIQDLMIKVAQMARQLREHREMIRMLQEDIFGLRNELGRPKSTVAETLADSLMGRDDERS